MKKSNRHAPVVFYIGLVVVFLVLLSTCFTGGMYAKYTAKDGDNNSARVAKFNVTDGFLTDIFLVEINDMHPGEVIKYTFDVQNNSEVAINFSVKHDNLTKNLPIVIEDIDMNFGVGEGGTVIFCVSWPIVTNGQTSTDSDKFTGQIDVIELLVNITQIN